MSTVISRECRRPELRFNQELVSGIFLEKCPCTAAVIREIALKDKESVLPLTRKPAAEFTGTFWMVLGGC
jgi:hypothetical protein